MPGPHAVHEALAAIWVACAAGAENGPPLVKVDFALEAEPGGAGTAPGHRRLTSGRVVLEGVAHWVVLPAKDRALVVADRVGAHHPHPSHRPAPSPVHREVNRTFTTERCNRVPMTLSFYSMPLTGVKQFLVIGQ